MAESTTNPPTVEDIVDGLRDHVWTLLLAGEVNAAMVLLRASLPDYLCATAEVVKPVQPLEGIVVVPPVSARDLARRPAASLVLQRTPPKGVNVVGGRVNSAESAAG
jgi:hypothetical protein